jgi:hypothetical protein
MHDKASGPCIPKSAVLPADAVASSHTEDRKTIIAGILRIPGELTGKTTAMTGIVTRPQECGETATGTVAAAGMKIITGTTGTINMIMNIMMITGIAVRVIAREEVMKMKMKMKIRVEVPGRIVTREAAAGTMMRIQTGMVIPAKTIIQGEDQEAGAETGGAAAVMRIADRAMAAVVMGPVHMMTTREAMTRDVIVTEAGSKANMEMTVV